MFSSSSIASAFSVLASVEHQPDVSTLARRAYAATLAVCTHFCGVSSLNPEPSHYPAGDGGIRISRPLLANAFYPFASTAFLFHLIHGCSPGCYRRTPQRRQVQYL